MLILRRKDHSDLRVDWHWHNSSIKSIVFLVEVQVALQNAVVVIRAHETHQRYFLVDLAISVSRLGLRVHLDVGVTHFDLGSRLGVSEQPVLLGDQSLDSCHSLLDLSVLSGRLSTGLREVRREYVHGSFW